MADKKQDLNYSSSLGGNENLIGNAFVLGHNSKNGAFDAAGVGLSAIHPNGHAANLTAMHMPKYGQQVTGAATVNLEHTEDHKLDANAFNTTNFPMNQPSYSTHGGGVDYMFRQKVGANASVAHTPMFKQTDTSIGARLNLHQTQNSSLNLSASANRSTGPFTSNDGFKPSFWLSLQKKF